MDWDVFTPTSSGLVQGPRKRPHTLTLTHTHIHQNDSEFDSDGPLIKMYLPVCFVLAIRSTEIG